MQSVMKVPEAVLLGTLLAAAFSLSTTLRASDVCEGALEDSVPRTLTLKRISMMGVPEEVQVPVRILAPVSFGSSSQFGGTRRRYGLVVETTDMFGDKLKLSASLTVTVAGDRLVLEDTYTDSGLRRAGAHALLVREVLRDFPGVKRAQGRLIKTNLALFDAGGADATPTGRALAKANPPFRATGRSQELNGVIDSDTGETGRMVEVYWER